MKRRTSHRLLLLMAALQATTLYSLWTGNSLPAAAAQIPDPGAQRIAQLEELRAISGRLDAIIALLKGGELQVRTRAVDEKKAAER